MKMKSILITLLVISYATFANAKILSESDSKIILDQCSRMSVDKNKVTGYWQPTDEQITELEKAFPAYYEAHKVSQAKPTNQLDKFHHNYAGIIYNGKKIIYADYQYAGEYEYIGVVCDGGVGFFGFEYDSETKTFNNLSFNGSS